MSNECILDHCLTYSSKKKYVFGFHCDHCLFTVTNIHFDLVSLWEILAITALSQGG